MPGIHALLNYETVCRRWDAWLAWAEPRKAPAARRRDMAASMDASDDVQVRSVLTLLLGATYRQVEPDAEALTAAQLAEVFSEAGAEIEARKLVQVVRTQFSLGKACPGVGSATAILLGGMAVLVLGGWWIARSRAS